MGDPLAPALRRCGKREPLTWWRDASGSVRVVCSRGHASMLRHIVNAAGRLIAPVNQSASCHCGWCTEELPLQLAGWVP